MTNVVTFQEALKEAEQYDKKVLFLGNGFSIACVPTIFTYRSLFEQADFFSMPEAEEVFRKLKTEDFEEVIHALENTSDCSENERTCGQDQGNLSPDYREEPPISSRRYSRGQVSSLRRISQSLSE